MEGQKMNMKENETAAVEMNAEKRKRTLAFHELAPKERAAVQSDFQLHVLLIQRQDAVSKSVATMRAWHEGYVGLDRRLSSPPSTAT